MSQVEINDEFNVDNSIDIMDSDSNTIKIVHIYNKSDQYHLTRQVLLDSTITQGTFGFFCHILTKSIEEFNLSYGSIAYLSPVNENEYDLYLNVDKIAFENIVKYVQTGKIEQNDYYQLNNKIIEDMIDLATIFGMPILVTEMRNLLMSDIELNDEFNKFEYVIKYIVKLLSTNGGACNTSNVIINNMVGKIDNSSSIKTDIDNFISLFFETNKSEINNFIRNNRKLCLFIDLIFDIIYLKNNNDQKENISGQYINYTVPVNNHNNINNYNQNLNQNLNQNKNSFTQITPDNLASYLKYYQNANQNINIDQPKLFMNKNLRTPHINNNTERLENINKVNPHGVVMLCDPNELLKLLSQRNH